MITNPLPRITAALTRLCAAASVSPDDGSIAAGRAVVGVLKRAGCLSAGDPCPLSLWLHRETGLAVYVSGSTGHNGGRAPQPGRVVHITGRSVHSWGVNGGTGSVLHTNVVACELPAAIDAAVRLVDAGHGMHKKGAA